MVGYMKISKSQYFLTHNDERERIKTVIPNLFQPTFTENFIWGPL